MSVPVTPQNNDAVRIPILEFSSAGVEPNANPAINSDIVKPIPPRTPAPKICRQLTPTGFDAHPKRVVSQANENIPIGLPRHKPQIMPRPNGLTSESATPGWKTT